MPMETTDVLFRGKYNICCAPRSNRTGEPQGSQHPYCLLLSAHLDKVPLRSEKA